jgi:predicted nucleotidyltransferase
VLPVRHTATGIPVDIVIAGPGIEELFLQRAQVHDLGGVKVPVACAEDVIVMKILGGRPKDLDDVSAILAAKRHDLDLELVKDTLRLIEHALDRSDLVSELERIAAQPLG